ncbi:MAG TPA: chromosomal replication initiator protein DnaA [Chthoniobacteraceae bacterium]|nr:chromosomal replication initiator protein DnaA [Chthoniobacteraceae bacterium]
MMTVDKPLKTDSLTAAWAAIAKAMKAEVSGDTFNRWFRDIELVELDAKKLTLQVPNNIYQLWIESNYMGMLRTAVLFELGSEREIRFTIAGNELDAPAQTTTPPTMNDEPTDPPEARQNSAGPVSGMNPRNTFELFVVGQTNEYAHAACLAVSGSPGKTYNPLFIYGGVGLGKTHLMQATGQAVLAKKRTAKVVYITSENFTNEFIDAIQNSTLVKFRKRYRQADILLIDDIQFLADKGRTQEEFFHTFNTLFDGHKQIVLSSDRPPNEIANLETRLVSRFEWGLTAELQPPDAETRVAILRKKAAATHVNLSNEIFEFLANRIRTNVRRLEGALMRVASYASLNEGQVPSFEKIEHLLKDLLQEEARRAITIDQIKNRVAEYYDVRLADMTSKRRPASIAFPRQVAMYLARELTKSSLSEIGQSFGGRDHGTVLHAHRLVKERIRDDAKIRQIVSFLDQQLTR